MSTEDPNIRHHRLEDAIEEVPLTGGGRTRVSRKGLVVLRETGPWAQTVHAFLRHLESSGFAGAPKVVGTGFDAEGRETLTYVEGEFVHPGPWPEKALPVLGRLLRELHCASRTFPVPDGAVWRPWFGRNLGGPDYVIGHCDTGPWNIVARDGMPQALIDWEVAGPVDPVYELAQACWMNAQLYDDDIAELQGLPSPEVRARFVRAILDGYDLPRSQRIGFVEKMIEFAVHDAAQQVIEANVVPETQDAAPLWAITWRTRSAAWMLRHRSMLKRSIEAVG